MNSFIVKSLLILTFILFHCFNTIAQQVFVIGGGNEGLCSYRSPFTAPGPKDHCGSNQNDIEQFNNTIQSLAELVKQALTEIQRLKVTIRPTNVQYFVDNCSVGMKYGDTRVRDQDITASTYHPDNYQPYRGRLGRDGIRSAWAASQKTTGDWLQVDLQEPKSVTGVITEGRGDTTHGEQWVSSYKISYSNSSSGFQVYEDENGVEVVFSQPTRLDRTLHFFRHPITARYFRLIVQTYVGHPSLRMDYITC